LIRLRGLRSDPYPSPGSQYLIFICIRILKVGYLRCRYPFKSYPTQLDNIHNFISDPNSKRKYENRYKTSDIRPYSIRLHPYTQATKTSPIWIYSKCTICSMSKQFKWLITVYPLVCALREDMVLAAKSDRVNRNRVVETRLWKRMVLDFASPTDQCYRD
jgi:hypothetical protein